MTNNKYRPHVLVLPEDKVDRQIANGFVLFNPNLNVRAIQVLPVAGGWSEVFDAFKNVHVHEMRKYPERRFILLIDFDNQVERRLNSIQCEIPDEMKDRVFVLGALSDPEKLNANMNYRGFEDIGEALSQDCSDNTQKAWGHEMLKHNKAELKRLIKFVKPFLFALD
jgi:hypothetical protein